VKRTPFPSSNNGGINTGYFFFFYYYYSSSRAHNHSSSSREQSDELSHTGVDIVVTNFWKDSRHKNADSNNVVLESKSPNQARFAMDQVLLVIWRCGPWTPQDFKHHSPHTIENSNLKKK